MRYCHPWRRWLIWDGKRWAEDRTGAAMRLAMQVAEAIEFREPRGEESRRRRVAQVANQRRLKSMLELAAYRLPVLPSEFDRHPWLLNCQNGTLDLCTGELREHSREDFITKLCPTPYLPDATCDAWRQFLSSVFPQPVLVEFIQRFLGYCLSGDVREQLLPIFWGEGSNGKSTLLETILHVLGSDYAIKAPADLLIMRKTEAHPTERADLFSKRFVACVESGQGRNLNETFVKELTGGDTIRARRLYENFWEFSPSHKVVLCTNYRPEVRGVEHAIWRRLALVPFGVTFWDPDKGESGPAEFAQDKTLLDRLRHEAAGILAWCVEGCRDWRENRLRLPAEVIDATLAYRYDQDVVAAFLEECCTLENGARVRASELYEAYVMWCLTESRRDIGGKLFGEAISRKFRKVKNSGLYYMGIEIAKDDETKARHARA